MNKNEDRKVFRVCIKMRYIFKKNKYSNYTKKGEFSKMSKGSNVLGLENSCCYQLLVSMMNIFFKAYFD